MKLACPQGCTVNVPMSDHKLHRCAEHDCVMVLPSQLKPRKPLRRVSEKRSGEVKRYGGWKPGPGLKRSQPKRDWAEADALKRTICRICGAHDVQLAHLVGRIHDRPKEPGTKTLWVNPDSVVALCHDHHRLFDAHALDLLGYLTPHEEAQAVLDAGGLEKARIRLCPSAYGELGK